MKRQFISKIGLIAATVGSAIGLGNVWRFPAETQTNGGAAFLLLYIVCVLLIGVPVMLAEFSIGRGGHSDAIGSFKNLSPGKKWWITGAVAGLASYLICIFYMVVAGWTLEYLWASVQGGLFDGISTLNSEAREAAFTTKMQQYVCTPIMPAIFTIIVVILNIIVLIGGVEKGIERLSNIAMPLLFLILLAMLVVSLTLPGAGAGVEFFLKPDFSKINAEVVVNALGQALFSLSIGMGILVTYSSYYPDNTKLGRTSVIVALLSMAVAVLMGLIIFPAVTSFGLTDQSLEGATLIFVTLPEVFANLPMSQLWSSLFFLLLFVAALTSTVSIAEVTIAMLQDRLGMKRLSAVLVVLVPMLLLSPYCSLSFSMQADVTIFGMTFFDFLDNFTTNILLPAVAFTTCLYVGFFAPDKLLHRQLTNNGALRSRLTPAIMLVIRYFAPAAIALIVLFTYL